MLAAIETPDVQLFVVTASGAPFPLHGLDFLGFSERERKDPDVGYGYVPHSSHAQLSTDNRMIELSEVDAVVDFDPQDLFIVVGYPWKHTKERQTVEHATGKKLFDHEAQMSVIQGHLASDDLYDALGRVRGLHILINFDQQRSVTTNGVHAVVVPAGMSGGGVWRVPNGMAYEHAKLVGVLIAHHAEERVLVATRISTIVDAVAEDHLISVTPPSHVEP